MPEGVITKEEAQQDLENMAQENEAAAERQRQAQMSADERRQADEAAAQEKTAREETEREIARKEALLAKPEAELTEDERKEREAYAAEKADAEAAEAEAEEKRLSPEERIKRVKDSTQKRIDELTNKLKQQEDSRSKDSADLEAKIEALEQKNRELAEQNGERRNPDEEQAQALEKTLNERESERIDKYLKEDAEKPRAERREMPKEDLEEWLLEDSAAAIEWVNTRARRRERERNSDSGRIQKDAFVQKVVEKQMQSLARVLEKNPDLKTEARANELKAQGLSETAIEDKLRQENQKYRMWKEIMEANPDLCAKDNGPELIAAKLAEKADGKNKGESGKSESERIAELEEQLEMQNAEIERLKQDRGINSNPRRRTDGKQPAWEEQLRKTSTEMGMAPADIDAAVERKRKEIEGR